MERLDDSRLVKIIMEKMQDCGSVIASRVSMICC